MVIKTDPHLSLNPGPSRRNSISGCKCLLIISTIVVLSTVASFVARVLTTLLTGVSDPFRPLLQNASLAEVSNRTSIVQPLIDHEQTFDLAATIWLRSVDSMEHNASAPVKEEEGAEEAEALETPLYSDIVFRGLRLTDKNIFSTINFTMPTDVFRSPNLSNFDLRASIMLLPASASLLDHVTNYSTWIPENIKPLPVRPWPFPLGSSDQRKKTLADEALDSFGVTVPLLQFNGVHSRCNNLDKGTAEDRQDEDNDSDDKEDEETSTDHSEHTKKMSIGIPALERTNALPVLKHHPYVVTRTRIRIVDETRLFNRKAYFKMHKRLQADACDRKSDTGPSRYSCTRDYFTNGHWETLLKLGIRNETSQSFQTEWAYAPYISVSRYPSGPKDLFPIPVNRENCSTESIKLPSNVAPEQDSVDITWHISYSGRTPIKHFISNFVSEIPRMYDHNQNETTQILVQESAEIAHGLAGNRFSKDAHPRRRAFIHGLKSVLFMVAVVLDDHYWYTRTSTVSISILGTLLMSGSQIIVKLGSFIVEQKTNEFTVTAIIGLLVSLIISIFTSLALPLLMMKAVLRVEFRWWKETTWIPTIQRVDVTHRERASQRLEATVSWRTKAGLLLLLAAIEYVVMHHNIYIITPRLKGDRPSDWWTDAIPLISRPLYLTGNILQLYLNWQSGSFAGSYKTPVFLTLLAEGSALTLLLPSITGMFEARPGITVYGVMRLASLSVAAWQAVTLPSISQTSDDEHTE